MIMWYLSMLICEYLAKLEKIIFIISTLTGYCRVISRLFLLLPYGHSRVTRIYDYNVFKFRWLYINLI